MGKHIIDTKIKIATCNRCKSYVFACEVAGLRTMADPKPVVDLAEARDALIAKRGLYKVLYVAGKPTKLQTVTRDIPAHLGGIVAGHDCGSKNSSAIEVPPPGPHQALVKPGRHQDGYRPDPVHVEAHKGAQDSDLAIIASPRRFDWRDAKSFRGPWRNAPRCVVCGELALLRHPVTQVPHHKVCDK